tara:strand:- start:2034 stop:2375 length:342 start_codon:yes stop_codon:yes gene_type:complete
MTIRAKWETRNDDENIMILHVDYRLWEPPPPAVMMAMMMGEKMPDSVCPAQRELTETLMGVHGVRRVAFDVYQMLVAKGEMFEWSVLAPRVVSVLESWSGQTVYVKDACHDKA